MKLRANVSHLSKEEPIQRSCFYDHKKNIPACLEQLKKDAQLDEASTFMHPLPREDETVEFQDVIDGTTPVIGVINRKTGFRSLVIHYMRPRQ